MTHPTIVELLLSIHGSVLVTSIAAFYLYGDRTDGFTGSLKGTTEVLTEIRRRICSELGLKLEPVFASPGSVPSPVLNTSGGTYVEYPINPVGSELYREAIRNYLEEQHVLLRDYVRLYKCRNAWCFWSSVLAILLVVLIGWQLTVLGALACDKMLAFDLPEWALGGLCTVSAVGVLCSLLCVTCRQCHYHTITNLRVQYGDL